MQTAERAQQGAVQGELVSEVHVCRSHRCSTDARLSDADGDEVAESRRTVPLRNAGG